MFHPTSFQLIASGRNQRPRSDAQSRGLPVGIKPITLLAIQFSKTDVLACASGVYYRLLSDLSTPVQPSAFGVSRGPPAREGAGFYHVRREREGLFAIFFACPLGRLLHFLDVLVGLERFELSTPRLSSACSNQLSYRPGPRAVHIPKPPDRVNPPDERSDPALSPLQGPPAARA